jgi:hypothetical protein
MRNIFKLTLTVVILMIASTSFLEAQSWKKNLKKLKDTQKTSTQNSGGDISASQDALLLQTATAVATLAEAQHHVALAQGNQELAEQLKNVSKALKGGDTSDIKGHVKTVNKAAKAQKEVISQKNKMSDDAKKHYQAALIPFLTSAALTAKLKDPATQFTKDATNQIKSIKNPLEIGKIKKSLDVGMYIGKNIPSLIKNILGTTGDLMSYSKDNGLDVSKAKSIEL